MSEPLRSQQAYAGPRVIIETESVIADVPVAGDGVKVACRLRFEYRARDPLSVDVSVQAPSGAPAIERTVLRADLCDVGHSTITFRTLVMGPAEQRRFVQVIFVELGTSLGVLLPSNLIEDFLHATFALVPRNDHAEASALSRAAADFYAR